MSYKLVILDLNGTLLLRPKGSAGNRRVWARSFAQSFLSYLFHPTVSSPLPGTSSESQPHTRARAGLNVLVWSSAQPHSVQSMVESVFGVHATKLVGIWDRTYFGLSKAQYNNKTPTIKDLTRVWKVFTRHSSKSTILLDDSEAKAARQPDNHICLTEYTREVRANDVLSYRNSIAAGGTASSAVATSITSEERGVGGPYDSLLLAVVGILEEMREKDDVAAWLRDGGLRIHSSRPAANDTSTSEDAELSNQLSGTTLVDGETSVETTLLNDTMPAHANVEPTELSGTPFSNGEFTAKPVLLSSTVLVDTTFAEPKAGEVVPPTATRRKLRSATTLPNLEFNTESAGLWFDDPEVLEYWVEKGKAALRALEIPILPGIAL